MADPLVVKQTPEFARWRRDLRDRQAAIAIDRRIDRLARGLVGDAKSVGEGVLELRLNLGPGYRVYFTYRGTTLVILLCGGDKSTQTRDIALARNLAERQP